MLAKHGNTSNLLAHLRTNHPALHSLAKAGIERKGKKELVKLHLDSLTSLRNASRGGSDVCSVRTNRRKIEGAHSNFFIAKDSLPI